MRHVPRLLLCLALLSACGPEEGTRELTCFDYGPKGLGEPCRKGQTCECTEKCVPGEDDAICYPIIEPEKSCTSNADCYSAFDETAICGLREASCPGGVKAVCVHGCAKNQDCPESMQCVTLNSHRCVPKGCAEPCPINFECSAENGCVRRECEIDEDCPGAYCVEGHCHAELGLCTAY